jgi:hypothetical protein
VVALFYKLEKGRSTGNFRRNFEQAQQPFNSAGDAAGFEAGLLA